MWSPLVLSLLLSLGDFYDLQMNILIAVEHKSKNHFQGSPSLTSKPYPFFIKEVFLNFCQISSTFVSTQLPFGKIHHEKTFPWCQPQHSRRKKIIIFPFTPIFLPKSSYFFRRMDRIMVFCMVQDGFLLMKNLPHLWNRKPIGQQFFCLFSLIFNCYWIFFYFAKLNTSLCSSSTSGVKFTSLCSKGKQSQDGSPLTFLPPI